LHWGVQSEGADKQWGKLLEFFEMMHFGAKVTNAVHHHWFSGEKTDLRLINFCRNFGRGRLNPYNHP